VEKGGVGPACRNPDFQFLHRLTNSGISVLCPWSSVQEVHLGDSEWLASMRGKPQPAFSQPTSPSKLLAPIGTPICSIPLHFKQSDINNMQKIGANMAILNSSCRPSWSWRNCCQAPQFTRYNTCTLSTELFRLWMRRCGVMLRAPCLSSQKMMHR
jgi:hypothetical protein